MMPAPSPEVVAASKALAVLAFVWFAVLLVLAVRAICVSMAEEAGRRPPRAAAPATAICPDCDGLTTVDIHGHCIRCGSATVRTWSYGAKLGLLQRRRRERALEDRRFVRRLHR